MIKAFILLTAVLLVSASSNAAITLDVTCEGDSLRFEGSIFTPDVSYESCSMAITAFSVLVCGEPSLISHDTIPFPPAGQTITFSISYPGDTYTDFMRFQAWRMDDSGVLHHPDCMGGPPSFDDATCADAPFWMGRLFSSGSGNDPCGIGCWPDEVISFVGIQEQWDTYVDTNLKVQIFGVMHQSSMPGGNYFEATRIDLLGDGSGCGWLGSDDVTWSELKTMYR